MAVGSSIGHAIGGFFGGGSSAPAESQSAQTVPAEQEYANSSPSTYQSGVCQTDVNNFRKCMDENQGSLTICGWYLDQLVSGAHLDNRWRIFMLTFVLVQQKACQQAASQY